ncbi:hypothetical protein CAL29_29050 [Bordetella genomosp. 10]|uniref:Uncharacterized protein n=1 Tax=Bordetella genomosp. 10 TaxID=1416804 RepID=A0A261S3I8_9BORD|nr:hypothetical protein [Bordetella genomosp. 10]OZI31906.1 hypothetical protein CAL29_29050 [Bordetella genomosp. 10]
MTFPPPLAGSGPADVVLEPAQIQALRRLGPPVPAITVRKGTQRALFRSVEYFLMMDTAEVRAIMSGAHPEKRAMRPGTDPAPAAQDSAGDDMGASRLDFPRFARLPESADAAPGSRRPSSASLASLALASEDAWNLGSDISSDAGYASSSNEEAWASRDDVSLPSSRSASFRGASFRGASLHDVSFRDAPVPGDALSAADTDPPRLAHAPPPVPNALLDRDGASCDKANEAARLMDRLPEEIRMAPIQTAWAKARRLRQDLTRLASLDQQAEYYRNGGFIEEGGKAKGSGDGPLRSVATLCQLLEYPSYADILASFPAWPQTSGFLKSWGNQDAYQVQDAATGDADAYTLLRAEFVEHLACLEQVLLQVKERKHPALRLPPLDVPPTADELSPSRPYGKAPSAAGQRARAPRMVRLWTGIRQRLPQMRRLPAAIMGIVHRARERIRAWFGPAPGGDILSKDIGAPLIPTEAAASPSPARRLRPAFTWPGATGATEATAEPGEYRRLSEDNFSDIAFIDEDETDGAPPAIPAARTGMAARDANALSR